MHPLSAREPNTAKRLMSAMTLHRSLLTTLCLLCSPVGCTQDGAEPEGEEVQVSSDPRCQALCSFETPELDGVFEVCSMKSLDRCAALCEVRIEAQSNICAECLLEEAVLYTPRTNLEAERCTENGDCYVGLSVWCEGNCLHRPGSSQCGDQFDCSDPMFQQLYDEEVTHGDACRYDEGDEAGLEDCHREIYPREEVTCEVEFAAVSRCADVC